MDGIDWTDRELRHELKKFGSLKEEYGELVLHVEGKRLLDGPQKIVVETLRRFKEEIQHVILNNCYIDDNQCDIFITQIKKLNKLKTLKLESNILTKITVQRIIEMYDPQHFSVLEDPISSKHSGNHLCYLEALDLRNNSLTSEDGLMLFSSFIGPSRICKETVVSLNGLKINEILNKKDMNMLDIEGHSVRITEIVIICELLKEVSHITSLNFRNNFIDVKAGAYLIDSMGLIPHIESIDLSDNPLTYEGKNLSTIYKLAILIRQNIHIKNVNLGDLIIPYELRNRIDISLQVNRSLSMNNTNKDSFELFINDKLNDHVIAPVHPYRNWCPVLKKDEIFCEKYSIPGMNV
mmetsp:Transcript_24225/g.23284  ORF Transcript_24225/g.23284 Transcript_24225/m.23284 type:complete len:351 (-) Transcript_24225:80-1132(-)